jgi:kringle domain-containing protein/hormone receptor domain-containing protein
VWAAEDTEECVAIPTECAAEGVWPVTDVGSTASIACASGFTGSRTRTCGAAGVWGAVDTTSCVAIPTECAAEGVWPATDVGSTATVSCASGFTGTRTRACGAAGVWAAEDTTSCVAIPTECAADGAWPATTIGSTATLACPIAYAGSLSRACGAGGVWADADDACVPPPETCSESDQNDYRGLVNVTRGGLTCAKWTSQSPHRHTRTPERYPGFGLGDHNYCRNPDGEPGAWCYTTSPSKRWDLCDVSCGSQ